MKNPRVWPAILMVAGLTSPVGAPLAETVVLDRSTTNQVIRSWGAPFGGLVWQRDPVLNAILDELVFAMGLNRTRLEPGRREWEDALNDNSDPFDAEPAAYRLGGNREFVERFVMPFKRRVEGAGDRFDCYVSPSFFDGGSSGSVPAWMLNHPGEYAEWAIHYLEYLRTRHGLVPDFYSICNEAQNNNPFSPAVVSGMIRTLGPRLEALGFTTRIQFPESVNADTSYSAIQATQSDAEMWQWVGMVSYHLYGGNGSRASIRDFARTRGLPTGQTEYMGLTLDHLYQDLIDGGVSTWEFYASDDFLPLNANRTWFTRNANFWQIRQVTRFVRPGAVRVAATSSNTGLRALAFDQGGLSVLILINLTGGIARTAEVSGLAPGEYARSQTVSGASATELGLVTVPAGGTLSVSLPANSVYTLYPRVGRNLLPAVTDYKATPAFLKQPTASVVLSATATDPERAALSYAWSAEQAPAGATVRLNAPQSASCSVSGLTEVGDYLFRLRVSDGAGDVTRVLPVTVYSGNQPPELNDYSLHNRLPVMVMLPTKSTTLRCFTTDLENDPVNYRWSVVSQPEGANALLLSPTQTSCVASNLTRAGIYVFRMTANDPTHTVSRDLPVTVHPANTPLSIARVTAQPSNITLPLSEATLTGEASDPDGDALSYWWSVRTAPAGALPVFANPGSRTTKVLGLLKPGAYGLRLTVVDRASFRTSDFSVSVAAGASGPLLFVVSPRGGETYTSGQSVLVRWSSYQVSPNVRLEWFDGTSWSAIAETTPNDGVEAWTLPVGNFSGCRVRVSDTADTRVVAEHGKPFSITRDTPRILGAGTATGGVSLTITQRPGWMNTLQHATTVNAPSWESLVVLTNFALTQTLSVAEPGPAAPASFYRVRCE